MRNQARKQLINENKLMEGRKTEIAMGRKNMGTINLKSLYSVTFMPVFITPPWWHCTEISNE